MVSFKAQPEARMELFVVEDPGSKWNGGNDWVNLDKRRWKSLVRGEENIAIRMRKEFLKNTIEAISWQVADLIKERKRS